jgi:hypothetical protein
MKNSEVQIDVDAVKDWFATYVFPEDLPNVLFIDEVTHFGAHELFILNHLVELARLNNKPFRILAAGDHTQSGFKLYANVRATKDKPDTLKLPGLSFNVDYVKGIFPPRLSLTVRALNNQKRKTNEFSANIARQTAIL